MPSPTDPSRGGGRLLAQAGGFACAFAVFLCGWFAMRAADWKGILLFTALAVVAALMAAEFRKRTR